MGSWVLGCGDDRLVDEDLAVPVEGEAGPDRRRAVGVEAEGDQYHDRQIEIGEAAGADHAAAGEGAQRVRRESPG